MTPDEEKWATHSALIGELDAAAFEPGGYDEDSEDADVCARIAGTLRAE